MKKIFCIVLAFALMGSLAGCGGQNASSSSSSPPSTSSSVSSESSSVPALDEAGFPTLLDNVYTNYEVMGVVDFEENAIKDVLGLEKDMYDFFAGRQSLARFNIGDVIIVRPTSGNTEAVKEKLEAYRKSKEDQFKEYNVGGDYEKAQNAVIYERGGYVVFIMTENNDPAKKLIDEFIPE